MRTIQLVVAFVAVLVASVGHLEAAVIYMRSSSGQPWGQNTNESAMDAVFGSGRWSDLRYDTSTPSSVFSSSNTFAFLEGSDFAADELEGYLDSNISTIESWVNAGGRLFINAAPNQGDGMSLGFGGVNLVYAGLYFSNNVIAVNPSHPIFTGPFSTSTSFSGNSFAHAQITGGGLNPMIVDSTDSNIVVLAEKRFGLGYVIFGGMTTTNWHNPSIEALNLRANILNYGATVPEPSSLTLFGIGTCVAGIRTAHRRRRSKQQEANA